MAFLYKGIFRYLSWKISKKIDLHFFLLKVYFLVSSFIGTLDSKWKWFFLFCKYVLASERKYSWEEWKWKSLDIFKFFSEECFQKLSEHKCHKKCVSGFFKLGWAKFNDLLFNYLQVMLCFPLSCIIRIIRKLKIVYLNVYLW